MISHLPKGQESDDTLKIAFRETWYFILFATFELKWTSVQDKAQNRYDFGRKKKRNCNIGFCKNCCWGTLFCHSAQSTLTYVLVLTRPYPQRFGTSKNPLFRGSDHSAENRGNDHLVSEAF